MPQPRPPQIDVVVAGAAEGDEPHPAVGERRITSAPRSSFTNAHTASWPSAKAVVPSSSRDATKCNA